MTNRHTKFQRFWLRKYRDRRLSMFPAIRARIQVGYVTHRAQLLHSPRDPNNEPPCKIQETLVALYVVGYHLK